MKIEERKEEIKMKKVIGIQRVDYYSKKASRQVQGYNIFCTFDAALNLIGVGCINVYMNDGVFNRNLENLKMVKPDDIIGLQFADFVYNQYGNVQGFYL